MPRLLVLAAPKNPAHAGFFVQYGMPERRLFFIQASLIAAVGAVHILALRLYLYWQFPWLDTFVHFFGALWVALAVVWMFSFLHRNTSFVRVFGIIVAVSIGWELFELWGGIPREANFVFDTAVDLISDSLGGIVGFFAARHIMTLPAPHRNSAVGRGGQHAEGVGEPRTVPRGGEQDEVR